MHRIVMLAGVWMVGVWVFSGGCGQTQSPASPEPKGSKPTASAPGESLPGEESGLLAKPGGPASSGPVPAQPPLPSSPPTIPKVIMDEARRATFRVWLGDVIPDGQLQNFQGQPVAVRSLWGQKLTVLVFWNSQSLSALEELQDLAKDLLPKYQEKGLRVVAIHVGEEPSAAQKALPKAASTLPVLLDPTGQYFAQIAQPSPQPGISLLPRTYVIDNHGKVLWLDIGYAATTLRAMDTTIQAVLAQ